MLPKKKRITKELFQEIMTQGRVISSPLFTFRYQKKNTPQYAFVVPKNKVKKAILRNALRRQGYNVLKSTNLPKVAGIFFFKNGKLEAKLNLKADILNILSKIAL
jgi:ribonuclease P protein component